MSDKITKKDMEEVRKDLRTLGFHPLDKKPDTPWENNSPFTISGGVTNSPFKRLESQSSRNIELIASDKRANNVFLFLLSATMFVGGLLVGVIFQSKSQQKTTDTIAEAIQDSRPKPAYQITPEESAALNAKLSNHHSNSIEQAKQRILSPENDSEQSIWDKF